MTQGFKTQPSGIRLDDDDAAVVNGMLLIGARHYGFAAWFGVNGGRVAGISTGAKFAEVEATHQDLPPPGSYPSGRQSAELLEKLGYSYAAE